VGAYIAVTNGRIESVEGGNADVKQFKEMIAKDENAGNFVAELGIGTSHTISGGITGSVWDFARKETVHMAVGRNNDIGGATWSQIHKDLLMTKPTIELDGEIILENGKIKI
jgi:leucyl aminopeptidase (aminopeptidase T)